MAVILIFVLFLIPTTASENCQTPNHKLGKCVLINHCPHLFATFLHPATNTSKDLVRTAHCGFQSGFFPKVCCAIPGIQLYPSKTPPKCGFHTPEAEEDPWLALIEYEIDGKRVVLCEGVLIHKKYILTPAHCVRGRNIPRKAKIVNVRLGGIVAQVEDVIVHEDYDPDDIKQNNNVALIRTKKKVLSWDGSVQPICLPGSDRGKSGDILQLTGWEKSGNSFVKRLGIAKVWNNSECELVHNVTTLGENHICVGGQKKSFVQPFSLHAGDVLTDVGDDHTYSLVGMTSLRLPCCDQEDVPKVYTRVSSYINWIFNNMDL